MKRIRLPVALLLIWLFVFYNIERLSSFVNLSQVAYIFVPVAAIALLFSAWLQRINIWVYASSVTAVFLLMELWLGYGLGNVPIVLTEVFVLVVTIILARMVSDGVTEFELAVINITLGQMSERRSRQGEMYREVKRARIHQRPLTLMAVKPESASVEMALDRMVREAQSAMVRQYVLSRVSKTLYDEVEDFNIIAKHRDHFLILLPETPVENLPDLIKRVRRAVADRVGVSVQVGAATLSKDITTFEALVERATAELTEEQEQLMAWPSSASIHNRALDKTTVRESSNGRADH
jgi:hypothetical protein